MSLRKKQHKVNNHGNELFSNFVVDLRQFTKDIDQHTEKKISKEEIKFKNIVDQGVRKFKKNANSLKPNLLKNNYFRKSFFPILTQQLSLKKGKRFFRRLFLFKKNYFFEKVISEQQKIFAAKTKIRTAERRTNQAEEKVIWYRSLLSFSLVLLLLIVPLKILSYFEFFDLQNLENKILGRSQQAISSLLAAVDSVAKLDLAEADSDFQQASQGFLAAQEDLNKISDSLLSLAVLSNDPKIKLAAESKKFLTAGALVSSLGRNLVLATDSLFNGDSQNFSQILDNFSHYGQLAVNDAQELKKELNRINPDNLPLEYQSKFIDLNRQATLMSDNLVEFVKAADQLKEILGLSQDKRYLLIFQNNSELRASGGFLGSHALIDLSNGKIKNLEVPGGGSYDTEAGLKIKVIAPEPLWLVNPLWHFWDANWWPDWPTTAKNLMWFYEKSDGPTVDGVIGITPTVVERLLEVTGPIDLTEEYGLIIDANNFWETVQKIVEHQNLIKIDPEIVVGLPATSQPINSSLPLEQNLEVNSANKPKKIIGDLMAKILEVLPSKLNKENLLKIISLFEKNLSEKQILFYFNDYNLQAEIARHNWSGEIKDTNHDYLLVVNSNIAGQKSDRKMQEKIEHFSEISSDGSIINTVRIYRSHNGVKNEPLVGVRNVDWLRIYVPRGSKLLEASGFRYPDEHYFEKPEVDWINNPLLENERQAVIDEASGVKIYEENNKTVFANWVMVDPGETVIITFKYRLPFNFFDKSFDDSWLKRLNQLFNPDFTDLLPYSLLVQKQPGASASQFSSYLKLPSDWQIFWRHPENISGEINWSIQTDLGEDKYWSVLLEKNN